MAGSDGMRVVPHCGHWLPRRISQCRFTGRRREFVLPAMIRHWRGGGKAPLGVRSQLHCWRSV